MLNDENSVTRGLAVEALRQFDDASIVPQLIARLDDENAHIRRLVARAIGYLDHANSIDQILTRRSDDEEPDSNLAMDALIGLAHKTFDSNDVEGAAELFKDLACNAEEPHHSENFHNDAAYCFILLKRFEEAAEHLDKMYFRKRSSLWPLFQHNRGVLLYLMGDVENGRRCLEESLAWIRATENYDARDVLCMLLLGAEKQVSSHKDLPVDAGILLNLYRMGGLSSEGLILELRRRYRTEYERWIKLMNDEGLTEG